jgi:hypothetical protein
MHKNLLTKAQILELLANWKVNVDIPTKSTKSTIAFPNEHLNVAEITWSNHKGTYGDRLYELVMYHKGT